MAEAAFWPRQSDHRSQSLKPLCSAYKGWLLKHAWKCPILPFSTQVKFTYVPLTVPSQQFFYWASTSNFKTARCFLTKMYCKSSLLLHKYRPSIIKLLKVSSNTLNKFWIKLYVLDFAFHESIHLKHTQPLTAFMGTLNTNILYFREVFGYLVLFGRCIIRTLNYLS